MTLSRDHFLQFMQDQLAVDITGVNDDTPLFSSNLLDSFSIVEVIAFIEKEAGIRVDAWDVSLDNLDSIERILRFAQSKRND